MVADGKPVPDAVIFESKADMGPEGMATMGAPVKALPAKDGIYSFEVDPGMPGTWALHLAAKVYIFEDPTAGVDVGAKAEIYRLFDVALQASAAILIVSTDFEEVAKVCHRAIVFDRGRVVAELAEADLSVENLLAAASARIGRAEGAGASERQARSAHAVH